MSNDTLALKAEKRSEFGKGPSRRLRADGKVPAVVYGHGKNAVPLSVSALDMLPFVHHTGLMEINIDGRKRPVTAVVKDLQYDVIKGSIEHVDFQEVRATEIVSAMVPIEAQGEAAGISKGGVLDQQIHEIEIRCPANKLPELIEVDVTALDIDDTLTVGDLSLPEETEATAEADQIAFLVTLPTMEEPEPEEGEAEELEEAEEPEVIGKGKQEEEEEAEESEA
ncbi:MAG: 50S ribosomal protein L25 [Lentisphaeria bacterium]